MENIEFCFVLFFALLLGEASFVGRFLGEDFVFSLGFFFFLFLDVVGCFTLLFNDGSFVGCFRGRTLFFVVVFFFVFFCYLMLFVTLLCLMLFLVRGVLLDFFREGGGLYVF